jgi:hypothetical protein
MLKFMHVVLLETIRIEFVSVYSKVAHFLKKQEFTKVHSIMLSFYFFWYHGFNGNKVLVSKAIDSTLI